MRAAHSLKGAARIVGVAPGVAVAHAIEDCLVAAQQGGLVLRQTQIGVLLGGVDLLVSIAKRPDFETDVSTHTTVEGFIADLAAAVSSGVQFPDTQDPPRPDELPARSAGTPSIAGPASTDRDADRVFRVSVDNLNRLVGLASESLVHSHQLKTFSRSLLMLKRLHYESRKAIETLRDAMSRHPPDERTTGALDDLQKRLAACQQFLSPRLAELEAFDHYSTGLAHRLYHRALACRMRPFSDGVTAFPRMVRDLARALGKQARLDIIGASTQIDRDILERLEGPLGHLLRNAVDHGIEMPDERRAGGKPEEGVVALEARHSAGMLQITLSDDGRGIVLIAIRKAVTERGLSDPEIVSKMNEGELLDFLFLPGFTTKRAVTDISGRGVGLDVMRDTLRQVRGSVHVSSQPGRGTRFQFKLPLTLSVVRTLIANVGNEPYAFPLSHIVRAVKLPKDKIDVLEGRQHFDLNGVKIALITTHQLLSHAEPSFAGAELSVIVVGDQQEAYGLVVDAFLGERELVVQPLDPRLGKVKDIAAAALMEDGSPVLIVDVEDMIRSAEKLALSGDVSKLHRDMFGAVPKRKKRVLVVDDSLTVREVQRKLLNQHGYQIELAVDGLDGWNTVRTGRFDLIITDIDMPRMDGIELVTFIRKDPQLKSLPVMIVSYKDREEDRRRGLDAGADYYLAKSSFHDQSLLQAVIDLIGEADR